MCSNSIRLRDPWWRQPEGNAVRSVGLARTPVGAVYDRARSLGMHSRKFCAVIDRAYRGISAPTSIETLAAILDPSGIEFAAGVSVGGGDHSAGFIPFVFAVNANGLSRSEIGNAGRDIDVVHHEHGRAR